MMYHRVWKRIVKLMEATSMDKKRLIKTLINVLPIVIVPLVVERKRIKEHPDVRKATDAPKLHQKFSNYFKQGFRC